ncbi:hypothetical protein [Falsiroseomonas sp. E2-1-a20]|uniref:hypothetical protein n=1 Tax=Falsiroseomonas sp. E2-1-a20 TaxID=3239300 RepID=UPI003F417523
MPEDDATIRHSPAPDPGRNSRVQVAPPRVEWGSAPAAVPAAKPVRRGAAWMLGGVALAGFVAVGLGAWWVVLAPGGIPVGPPVVAAPAPVQAEAPPPALPAALPVPTASRLAALPPLLEEAALRDHRADAPVLLRLAENPAVFLIDFPTLEAQGAAMNRIAALVEKAGLPRDRVLGEAEMAAAIARAGDTAATFYYGHNYRGSDLQRFFDLAQRDAVVLSPGEAWVEAQVRLARGLVPAGQEMVLLSIAAPGPLMDATGRASILRHELSHGRYGTDPAYAAGIREAWRQRLTEAERAAIRAFLGREGYDTADEELMINEAQAYLLHTPDPRFFTPAHIGMDEAQVERLRGLLRQP